MWALFIGHFPLPLYKITYWIGHVFRCVLHVYMECHVKHVSCLILLVSLGVVLSRLVMLLGDEVRMVWFRIWVICWTSSLLCCYFWIYFKHWYICIACCWYQSSSFSTATFQVYCQSKLNMPCAINNILRYL